VHLHCLALPSESIKQSCDVISSNIEQRWFSWLTCSSLADLNFFCKVWRGRGGERLIESDGSVSHPQFLVKWRQVIYFFCVCD